MEFTKEYFQNQAFMHSSAHVFKINAGFVKQLNMQKQSLLKSLTSWGKPYGLSMQTAPSGGDNQTDSSERWGRWPLGYGVKSAAQNLKTTE